MEPPALHLRQKLKDGLTPSQSDINTQQRPVCPRLTPDVMITYFPSTTTKLRGSEFGAAYQLQQTCPAQGTGSEFPCKAQALPPGLALTGSVPLCRLTAAKAQEHARSQSEWKLHFSWKTASPRWVPTS